MLNDAHKRDELTHVPAIPYVDEQRQSPEFLAHEEVHRLLGELPDHLALKVEFALANGLRESNFRCLEWRQVDLGRYVAWVRCRDAKQDKPITVPLNDDAMNVLQACVGADPVRAFTYHGRTIDYKVNNTAFPAARARAGRPHLRRHDLRHTWAGWARLARDTA